MSSQKPEKQNIVARPPIVTVMGHIDHGKSALLDYIRKTNVVGGEVGGITQRLSAYEATHKTSGGEEKKITFLDTPGHEAFQKMRSNSATAADIAILIVSAEDGVKAQTVEAFKAIAENNIPYIVAISKIDKPNANIERAKQTLVENEIYIEGYGGDVPCAEISSKTGDGVPELLDMVLLMADMEELTGDTNRDAEGIIVESHMDSKTGASATILIRNGTLKNSMFITSGKTITPVRWIDDFRGKKITTAQFSMPVYISGWSELPETGAEFFAHATKKEAENWMKECGETKHCVKINTNEEDSAGTVSVPVILRADALGAIDAIRHEIEKIHVDNVRVKILSSGGGNITENDIKMAYSGNNALVIGFGDIKIDASAREMADRFNITIVTFEIIYKLSEWLAEELEKRRPRVVSEEKKGVAKIMRFFSATKNARIAGGKVLEGVISLGDNVRILRRDFEIGRGKIVELQQQKSKTKQVAEGYEFGVKVETKCEMSPGDMMESYDTIER